MHNDNGSRDMGKRMPGTASAQVRSWNPVGKSNERRGIRSGDRNPSAIGITARGTARNLRLAVDIDGVGVLAALLPIRLVVRSRYHRTVATGIRIAPRHHRTWPSSFQRLDLGRIGALLVFIIHGR